MSETSLIWIPRHHEIRASEEDWSGLSSAAERRKLQNRLNQRARRTTEHRLPLQNIYSILTFVGKRKKSRLVEEAQTRNPATESLISQFPIGTAPVHPRSVSLRNRTICDLSVTEIQKIQSVYETSARSNPPRPEQLPTLTKFNVFRALLNNYLLLGLSIERAMKDDAISSFNHPDLLPVQVELLSSLQSTQLQRLIPHHPWIDTLPVPKLRDNILRNIVWFDSIETEFCSDLVGFFNPSAGRTGLVVWGESWDSKSWQFSDSLIQRWTPLLLGCEELVESTNFWRSRRGEHPIKIPLVTAKRR